MLDRDGHVITSDEFKPYYIVYANEDFVKVRKLQSDKYKKSQFLDIRSVGIKSASVQWSIFAGHEFGLTIKNMNLLPTYMEYESVAERLQSYPWCAEVKNWISQMFPCV